jgi:hypothetical protein
MVEFPSSASSLKGSVSTAFAAQLDPFLRKE